MSDEDWQNPYSELAHDPSLPEDRGEHADSAVAASRVGSSYEVLQSGQTVPDKILDIDPEDLIDVPPEPSFVDLCREQISTFLADPTHLYATIAVALGLFFGLVAGAISWNLTHPSGRYDLGQVTVDEVGLKGHLFLRWNKGLQYRLTLEPSALEKRAGFSLVVGNPPRPLSIAIRLQDAQGFLLCATDIVLKYDARNAAAFAASYPAPQAGPEQVEALPAAIDFVPLQAQEAAREHGRDLFQDQIGADGQIGSISAQGDLPCAKDSYQKVANWSFIPNFPSLAEQDALLKRLSQPKEKPAPLPAATAAARRKPTANPVSSPAFFYIETDDAIVDYDSSAGILVTSAGRSFFIDKTGAEARALQGREFPMDFHSRCDQTGLCTLRSAGAGLLHVRLRR